MVFIIIIAVAIFLWWSLVPSRGNTTNNDYNYSHNDVLQKAIFCDKYKYLIKSFLEFPDSKITESKKDSIRIVSSTPRVQTTFFMLESFGYYNIIWEHRSQVFGRHTLKWTFPVNYSQMEALDEIGGEISKYENKIMSKRYS